MINFQEVSFEMSTDVFSENYRNYQQIAFVGRSNAGKSTLINKICHHHKLAKISKHPGRTQMINCFKIAKQDLYFIDLPGYGFAKVSQSIKKKWQKMITQYLKKNLGLKGLIIVVDSRRLILPEDFLMIDFARYWNVPIAIYFSKQDKLNNPERQKLVQHQKQIQQLHQDLHLITDKKDNLENLKNWILQQWSF